jgi:signal transduction histidine kinase
MIRNLLDNARRHGAPPIEVTVRREAARAIVEVSDGGKGVPEAKRDRVFTPFHRLAGGTEGAGLGLALVQQIARLHGGDAAVTPRPGRPSCFQVSLPNLAATAA